MKKNICTFNFKYKYCLGEEEYNKKNYEDLIKLYYCHNNIVMLTIFVDTVIGKNSIAFYFFAPKEITENDNYDSCIAVAAGKTYKI